MSDPLRIAFLRLVELAEAPGGLLASPASLVAVYDGLQAASGEPGAPVAALSFASSALLAFGDAAAADEPREVDRLAWRGRAYLAAAVQAAALQN